MKRTANIGKDGTLIGILGTFILLQLMVSPITDLTSAEAASTLNRGGSLILTDSIVWDDSEHPVFNDTTIVLLNEGADLEIKDITWNSADVTFVLGPDSSISIMNSTFNTPSHFRIIKSQNNHGSGNSIVIEDSKIITNEYLNSLGYGTLDLMEETIHANSAIFKGKVIRISNCIFDINGNAEINSTIVYILGTEIEFSNNIEFRSNDILIARSNIW